MKLQDRVMRLEGVGRNDAPNVLIVLANESVDEAMTRELATRYPNWSPAVVVPCKCPASEG